MAIGYTELDFINGAAPALNAANMNHIDEGVKACADALDLETVAGKAVTQAANAAAQRTLLNVEDGADVTDEANVTAIEVATAEVTAAPAHWNVLVAGAKKRLTHAGFAAIVKAFFGFVANAVGFEMAGGTTSKKLTVDADASTSNVPTLAGKTAADAIGAATGATTAIKLANLTSPATTAQRGVITKVTNAAEVTTGTSENAITPATLAASTPSLNGIKFPATQVASADANTLDDYEEGTWTPTIVGSSTAGTQTYDYQVGWYTKVGRKVIANFNVRITAKDAAIDGSVNIGGLPFAGSGATNHDHVGSVRMAIGTTLDTGYSSIFGQCGAAYGTSIMRLLQEGSNKTITSIPAANIAATTQYKGVLIYIV